MSLEVRAMLYIPVAKRQEARDLLSRHGLLKHLPHKSFLAMACNADETPDPENPRYYCVKLKLKRPGIRKLKELSQEIPSRFIEIIDKFNVRHGKFVKVWSRTEPSAYKTFSPEQA